VGLASLTSKDLASRFFSDGTGFARLITAEHGSISRHTDKATSALFRAATASIVGGGSSTLFWQDSWIHGQCVERIAPAVFAVLPRARARSRTVALSLADHAWVVDISGARTV
jgi:hypothetical protein